MLFAHPRKTNVAILGSGYSLRSNGSLWSWTHYLTSCDFNRKKVIRWCGLLGALVKVERGNALNEHLGNKCLFPPTLISSVPSSLFPLLCPSHLWCLSSISFSSSLASMALPLSFLWIDDRTEVLAAETVHPPPSIMLCSKQFQGSTSHTL